jgi:hypothetical protein
MNSAGQEASVIHQVEPDTSGPYGDQVRHAVDFFRTGNADEVAGAWRAIVAQPAADAITLADAGGIFLLLYERRGDRHHLDEAHTLLHRATEIAPPSSAAAAVAASYLGTAYCLRFDADHDDADLQAALESCGRSLELSAPDDWRAPIYAANLAAATRRLYERAPGREVLDAAIDVFAEAAQATRPGSPVHRSAAVDLAELVLDRYERYGRADSDLADANLWGERALGEYQPETDGWRRAGSALMAARRARYLRTHDPEDLRHAALLRDALDPGQAPVKENPAQ